MRPRRELPGLCTIWPGDPYCRAIGVGILVEPCLYPGDPGSVGCCLGITDERDPKEIIDGQWSLRRCVRCGHQGVPFGARRYAKEVVRRQRKNSPPPVGVPLVSSPILLADCTGPHHRRSFSTNACGRSASRPRQRNPAHHSFPRAGRHCQTCLAPVPWRVARSCPDAIRLTLHQPRLAHTGEVTTDRLPNQGSPSGRPAPRPRPFCNIWNIAAVMRT